MYIEVIMQIKDTVNIGVHYPTFQIQVNTEEGSILISNLNYMHLKSFSDALVKALKEFEEERDTRHKIVPSNSQEEKDST